jgi:adenylate cyclase
MNPSSLRQFLLIFIPLLIGCSNQESTKERALSHAIIAAQIASPSTQETTANRRNVQASISSISFSGLGVLSELYSPEDIIIIYEKVIQDLAHAVELTGGTIVSIAGTSLMCFWEGDIKQSTIAAFQCAFKQKNAVDQLQNEITGASFTISIGVNSGPLTVLDPQLDGYKGLLIMGDSANTAYRLEAANNSQRSMIIASQETINLAKSYIVVKPIGNMNLFGQAFPIKIYEVVKLIDK